MKKILITLMCIAMVIAMMPAMAFAGNQNPCELTPCTHVAAIGETHFDTLEEAVSAANVGDEIKILAEGTYTVPTGKDVTITGAVDGVVFDNIGACGMNGANVTFNNVTFDYYPNTNYTGLQHSGNLVYNDCTFNGQVFLYGESETFNNCTFNQNSADAYNVWTYGAKKVAFNDCTFNSVGKSVLIYAESATIFNDVTVADCTFVASAAAAGKAAIEMDSSLTAGINLTIDSETTATGFDEGNVSENSLWNNKKGAEGENNDIKVVVGGETVLKSTFVAKIGEVKYEDLHEAMTAAKAGETVELLCDVDLAEVDGDWEPVSFAGKFDGKDFAIKNLTINKPGVANTGFITSLNGTFENVTFTNPTVTGGENTAVVAGRAGGSVALAKNITVNGTIKVETTHSGYARTGVIVGGWGYGNYENITVDGGNKDVSYVKHTGGGDGRYVAGIVGHADGVESYVNCTVKNITISGGWLCGGIAGPGPSDGLASVCVVENVDINAGYSGGMFGWYFGDGTIEDSTVKNVTFTAGPNNNGAIGGYGANEDATVSNVIIENVKNAGGEDLIAFAAKIGNDYYGSFKKALEAAAATTGEVTEVTIELLDDVEWETGAEHGSTPLIPAESEVTKVTIDGKGIYTLTATGKGIGPIRAANGATLEFKNLTIADESESYAEGNWEHGYLEFAGKLAFDNCKFVNAIMIEGEMATFTDCSFNSNKTKEYAVWVNNGTTNFDNCTFEGPRGLKMHEAYGSEIGAVYVEECTFKNITEKPGIAIGTLNTNTTVMVENCEFINCQPGDQGNYMYETDTDLTKLFKQNLVENAGNVVAAGKITGGILVDNTATNGEAAICYELLNVGNNSDVKVELYKGTELLMTKSRHFDNGGTITCSLYTVGTSSSWTQEPSPWKAYDCKMPTYAVLYINDVEIGKCNVAFTEQAWIDFAGTAEHVYSNGTCTICGDADPNYVPPTTPTYTPSVTIQKPVIESAENATVTLGVLGTTATITPDEGFEIVDVTVNGVSKGDVTTISGLKTGDKIVVITKAINAEAPDSEEPMSGAELIQEKLNGMQLVARSKRTAAPSGKSSIMVYWYDKAGAELDFDGVEIYRSTKKGSGYKKVFTSKTDQYYNTAIENGVKYYYKVRGYVEVEGEKLYTGWSLKAIRTAK